MTADYYPLTGVLVSVLYKTADYYPLTGVLVSVLYMTADYYPPAKSLAATSMVGYRPIVVGVLFCILLYIIAHVAIHYLSSSPLVVWCEPWGVESKNHSNAST